MIHTTARLWGAGSMLLNPGRLVDLLLDQLEHLSLAVLPPQVEVVPCRELPDRARFD